MASSRVDDLNDLSDGWENVFSDDEDDGDSWVAVDDMDRRTDSDVGAWPSAASDATDDAVTGIDQLDVKIDATAGVGDEEELEEGEYFDEEEVDEEEDDEEGDMSRGDSSYLSADDDEMLRREESWELSSAGRSVLGSLDVMAGGSAGSGPSPMKRRVVPSNKRRKEFIKQVDAKKIANTRLNKLIQANDAKNNASARIAKIPRPKKRIFGMSLDESVVALLRDLQERDVQASDYDLLLQLHMTETSTRRLRRAVVQAIPRRQMILGGEYCSDICGVCLETMEPGCHVKDLPCGHTFHSLCIVRWLRKSSVNCPNDGLPVRIPWEKDSSLSGVIVEFRSE